MARPDQRHPDNVDGDWYVDTRCIECDAARHYAPGLITSVHGKSVVARQPETDEETSAVWRAALACPTQSIGTVERQHTPEGVFPWELTDGVHLCGYNDRSSFGAHSYFVRRPQGNLLVDSPRFTRRLADSIEQMGGLSDILLSHRDDVADAEKFAERFGARVWIHEAEQSAAPYATNLIPAGTDTVEIRPGLVAIPTPGHTEGSTLYLLEDRYLFTGDTLHWSRQRERLDVFGGATWYSWDALGDSMAHISGSIDFEWVLPGHGKWHQDDPAVLAAHLAVLAPEMAGYSPDTWDWRPE